MKETSRTPVKEVLIFESELQAMADESLSRGSIETGGELYEWWTNTDQVVIALATPPGQGAIHKPEYFEQDLEHFRRTNAYLKKRFQVDFGGNHHSHHTIGLDRPSARDFASIKSIMEKNALPAFVEIILTHKVTGEERDGRGIKRPLCSQEPSCSAERLASGFPWSRRERRVTGVQANCYVYQQNTSWRAQTADLRVIPGESPLRMALRTSTDTCAALLHFPAPKKTATILLPHSDSEPSQITYRLAERLTEEAAELPKVVSDAGNVMANADHVLFVSSLPCGGKFCVAYRIGNPYLPEAVLVERGEGISSEDMSARILTGRRQPLAEIYRAIEEMRPLSAASVRFVSIADIDAPDERVPIAHRSRPTETSTNNGIQREIRTTRRAEA